MSYINFKEEVYKAKIQFENRTKNNERLFNQIKKDTNISSNYIPNEKYSFKEFNCNILDVVSLSCLIKIHLSKT